MYFKFKKIIRICCILAIVFIFIFFYAYFHQIERKLDIIMESGIREQEETIETNVISSEAVANTVTEENTNTNNSIGKIMIPKIDLVAEIKEGTEKEIIDSYVGHFEDTSLNKGNIGLAAHNRGTNIKAYFANIKNLQENDIIIYKTKEIERNYLVKTIKIIKDTDFSYLEPTEDNRITLITCVQNAPNYRLCVQGVEKVAK